MLPCLLVEPSLPLRWPPIGKLLLSGRKKINFNLKFCSSGTAKNNSMVGFSVESADVPKVADNLHSTLQPLKDFTSKSVEVNL
jgi:hypothetical protein